MGRQGHRRPGLFWTLMLGVALGATGSPMLAQGDVDPGGGVEETPTSPDPGREEPTHDPDVTMNDQDNGGPNLLDPDPDPATSSSPVDDSDGPGTVSDMTNSFAGGGDDSDDTNAAPTTSASTDGDGNWLANLFGGRN